MLLHVPAALNQSQVMECRRALGQADWVDGRRTAGGGPVANIKHNREISGANPVARKLGEMIAGALSSNVILVKRALPIRFTPPLFSCYEGGETYGTHVDDGLMQMPAPNLPLRADLAATLFISSPEDYDGGELTIEDMFGEQTVKLPAGDMIVYPASSLHRVQPVTRGKRLVSFFWLQSAIRSNEARMLLASLNAGIERFLQVAPNDEGVMHFMGVYNNLLRMWSEN
jgi:PKHD-type hydroxylase